MPKKVKAKRNAEKKRQKKALQKNRRRRAILKSGNNKRSESLEVSPSMFSDQEHLFWIAHGVNFLMSDYDEGAWKPLFPEAYDPAATLSFEFLADRLKPLSELQSMTPNQKAALAYAFQNRTAHFGFKLGAERAVAKTEGSSAKDPHQPLVWEMYHEKVMLQVLSRAQKE